MDIRAVVDNHLCAGCGACYGMCPSGAIEMCETLDGRIEPRLIESACNDCGACHSVCPQSGMSARMAESLDRMMTGPVVNALLAMPLDRSVFLEGQTNGTVRTLIRYALQSGFADAALCVCEGGKDPLRPSVGVIRSADELQRIAKSKYCPVNFGDAIRYIRASEGKYIIVGLGCQMQALERAIERSSVIRTRVKLRIGLFCDRILKYRAADFLLRKAGVDAGNVTSFDYRHKEWRGYPGDVRVVDATGRVVNVDMAWRRQLPLFYTPSACRLCVDKLNILSDIALGDPWGIKTGRLVRAATIARTRVGADFLADAEAAGSIDTVECSSAQIARGQRVDRRRAQCRAYKREMLRRGFAIPAVLRSLAVSRDRGKSRLGESLGLRISLWGESRRGAMALNHLPVWIVGIVSVFKRSMRFLRRCGAYAMRRVRAAKVSD